MPDRSALNDGGLVEQGAGRLDSSAAARRGTDGSKDPVQEERNEVGLGRLSEQQGNTMRWAEVDLAKAVVQAAQAEIGVREVGENRGPRVDAYNRYTGVKHAPWCASFVSFCFYKAGLAQPRTAWSPALFPSERCLSMAAIQSTSRLAGAGSRHNASGLVLGIHYPSKGRIAHCGIVTRVDGDWVYSVEGNTNNNGSREGDGVYAKKRHRRTIARYADWLRKEKI